jgi:DNA modification methylase
MNVQKVENTTHKIYIANAQSLAFTPDQSVDLIVTSPPYPMIELWDQLFISQNPKIKNHLKNGCGKKAFLLMHTLLDPVWLEIKRVLKNGAFVCINIGDATRRVGDNFQLYPNHTVIQKKFFELGFDVHPLILWWKPTNAPNKFLGSGMLAAGAYVTLEHEYILIFRKGVKQILTKTQSRKRSAAFPFELAYRLINMFSIQGDLVLDPFLGTGTTVFAAMASCRNSMGVEIEQGFVPVIKKQGDDIIPKLNDHIFYRINAHKDFIQDYTARNGKLPYTNKHYGFAVKTRQETDLFIPYIHQVTLPHPLHYEASYYNKVTTHTPHVLYN